MEQLHVVFKARNLNLCGVTSLALYLSLMHQYILILIKEVYFLMPLPVVLAANRKISEALIKALKPKSHNLRMIRRGDYPENPATEEKDLEHKLDESPCSPKPEKIFCNKPILYKAVTVVAKTETIAPSIETLLCQRDLFLWPKLFRSL